MARNPENLVIGIMNCQACGGKKVKRTAQKREGSEDIRMQFLGIAQDLDGRKLVFVGSQGEKHTPGNAYRYSLLPNIGGFTPKHVEAYHADKFSTPPVGVRPPYPKEGGGGDTPAQVWTLWTEPEDYEYPPWVLSIGDGTDSQYIMPDMPGPILPDIEDWALSMAYAWDDEKVTPRSTVPVRKKGEEKELWPRNKKETMDFMHWGEICVKIHWELLHGISTNAKRKRGMHAK